MIISIANIIGSTSNNIVRKLGLLDKYSGAAAAYSLRSLSVDSTDVVRVRRDSDNAEQDFTATEITDGTLATFVGSGNNGYVTTWYDQSGNSNDVTQTSAIAQPKIYDSVSGLVLENGNPALDFDGVNDEFQIITQHDISNLSSWILAASDGVNLSGIALGLGTSSGNSRWYVPYLFNSSFVFGYANNSNAIAGIASDANQHLFSAIAGITQGNFTGFIDGQSQGTANLAVSTVSQGNYGIGSTGSIEWGGTIQEVVIYNSDQSSNRIGIETNINNYYNIYT